jgi:predicted metalloprotease with PDZ domain
MKLLIYLLIMSFPAMTSAQNPLITYELGMSKPSTHLFEVNISFENLPEAENSIDLILPAWRPGRYLIFDFASGVQEFNALDKAGNSLVWKKIDKNTWRIDLNKNRNFSASYKVYSNEFSLRTRGLNDEHGFVDGTSLFMYSERYRSLPVILKVHPFDGWHVSTGLENNKEESNSFRASDYDYFVDSPLEIGNQEDIEFSVDNKEHVISFFGQANYNREMLINDFTKIIRKNLEFWGKLPYERYLFIIHCERQGSGGTEHINSCVLGIRPSFFETTDEYKGFLRLVSHEFFHTWNVKQLRPKGLTPYDYTKENYTEELWIAEGATSYYDGLIALRAGLLDVDDFYNEITNSVEEERRRPGNRLQSLSESSFDAWIKYWKNNAQQRYNTESDYYGKGADVSLILDLELRQRTENKTSLDDVFRLMYERFPLGATGYINSDFQKTCEELSATSFKQFFDDNVYGTKVLEWEKYLNYAGLELSAKDSTIVPAIGLMTELRGEKIFVKDVISGSAAEDATITSGDQIVALDYEMVSYGDMNKNVEKLQPGDSLTLTIFRNNKLKDVKLLLKRKKYADYLINKTGNPSTLQKKIYESWLGVKWD